MKVHLAYGKTGMDIDVPQERTDVVEPRYMPALPDPQTALRQALSRPIGSRPLRDLVSATDTVAIVISDLTRPMPTADVVGAIVDELAHVAADRITIFVGLGTHRKMTNDEVTGVLGDLARRYTVSQTECSEDGKFTTVGISRSGSPVRFVSDFLNCSARIITGLMEPHFFAGVSGGPKGILPGLAHMDTVIGNHSAAHLLHPQATWGVTAGNPLWEDIFSGAMLAEPTFLVNVTVNKDKRITGVFAGDVRPAFDQGATFVRQTAMAPVLGLYDVVVTTNSGYPLDLNLYQSVKGMSAAAMILKPGGTIITAAECWDGVPTGSRMEAILHAGADAGADHCWYRGRPICRHGPVGAAALRQDTAEGDRLPEEQLPERCGSALVPGAAVRRRQRRRERRTPAIWATGAGLYLARGTADHPILPAVAAGNWAGGPYQ